MNRITHPLRTPVRRGLHGRLPALAAVSAEEAAKLKTELTPLGAEKAGNKDGSIPAWTGGYTTPIPGDKPGGRRGDPFKDEKPLFSHHAKNVDQYADKLTDGTQGAAEEVPRELPHRCLQDAPHRRRAAMGVRQHRSRTRRAPSSNGDIVEGAYGGIPFPIPKTGAEVMWNHMLRWRGTSWQFNVNAVPGHRRRQDGADHRRPRPTSRCRTTSRTAAPRRSPRATSTG